MGWSFRKKWQMKIWQREQMPRKRRGYGGEEDRNCDGDCIENDLERMGKEGTQKELETADSESSKRKVRGTIILNP